MAGKEERIKARAHEIWQREKQVDGAHERHWEQASREIDEEDGGKTIDAHLSILGSKDAGIALHSDDAQPEGDVASLKPLGKKPTRSRKI